MKLISHRLLISVILMISVSGCFPRKSAPVGLGITAEASILEIASVGAKAKGNGWIADAVDCSTREFHCLDIAGHFSLAFPKRCENMSLYGQEKVLPKGLRIVGLDAHFSLPDASYFSPDFPKILLFYKRSLGFYEIREMNRDIDGEGFDPNDFKYRYTVKFDGKTGYAKCE